MGIDYDAAFESVVQRPWTELPQEQQDAAVLSDRQGQLAGDEPDAYALHDTLNYQRGHADVFREVYKSALHVPPAKGQRLLVVDIGAGAATVAIAINEALGRKARRRIDYLAFDPNPMMQDLGERVLDRLGAGFRSAAYIESLDALNFTSSDRLLFTFSYVSHQEAVSPADIDQWATLIGRAVGRSGHAVELIYTTASNIHSIEPRIPLLGQRLDQAGFKRQIEPISVRVPRRFPEPDSSEGRVQWKPSPRLWKVEAERWILRP